MEKKRTHSKYSDLPGSACHPICQVAWIKNGLLAVGDWGPRALEPKLDWRVLGFTLALSLLTTLAAAVLFQPLLMGRPRVLRDV